jgi:C_GCAxxG_C_C family probable redox protein
MQLVTSSTDLFAAGYSCSQAVLRAFAAELGLDPDTAARLAAAFGGGMSRTRGQCGAVSGALMVVGLIYGSADPADKAAKERAYAAGRDLLEEFNARHGSITCPGLLSVDISTEEGTRAAREDNLFKTVCPEYVRSAAQIAANLLPK